MNAQTSVLAAPSWGSLLDDGLVALPDALASVDEIIRSGGERVLLVRVAGGPSVEMLLDRGLDLGAAWWGGTPVAWRSPQRVDPGPGHGWEERFLGGLLATCGPDNVGPARDASGQHGSHHLTPAHDVRWWRERTTDGVEVHVSGCIGHTVLYGPRLVVEREVVVATGRPWVDVRDVVRNEGSRPVGVPLLYHVNVGAPLLRPGSRLLVDTHRTVLREPCPPGRDPLRMPPAASDAEAVVADHRAVTDDGRARAVLESPGTAETLVVEWDGLALPRLFTWAWPARGAWVLGVEPANAPMFGPERELPGAGAPVLEPGQEWRTGVRVGVLDAAVPT